MIDRKEIELLIRANLKGGRDLASIVKSIEQIESAINSQAEAAKKGERVFDRLKASQEALKVVQDELAAGGKGVKTLSDLNSKYAEQTERINKAKAALDEYIKKVGDNRTAAQQERVQKLTTAYERQQKTLVDLQRAGAALDAALKESGVDTKNLAAAQDAFSAAILRTRVAQERANREILDYNENVAKGLAVTRAAAEAQAVLAAQQAKLARLEEGNAADARLGKLQAQQRLQDAIAVSVQKRLDNAAKLARLEEGNAADARLGRQQAAERAASAAGRDTGLRDAAKDAEDAARKYTTLARASKDLRPRIVSLRDALEQMRNPAAASLQTLDGVEKQIASLAATINSGKNDVKEYADQFKQLQAAQRAIGTQAGLIDGFRNQAQALQAARAEFAAARGQVSQYAAEVRKGGDAGAQFTKPLAEAQIRLRQATVALRDQIAATRDSREALRAAGINTRDLAGAQQRLVDATRTSTQALQQLGNAAEQNAGSVNKARKGFSLFGDEGRTTLSFVQRLRGEILALTTAYFGIQGAIGLAADSLKAFTQQQGLRSSLAFALGGDPAQVGAEIEYVRKQAERLGISFEQASKGYAKFAAAAIKSGASVQETRAIFESFSEVARVINLTPDELNGLFNAIGQSFSKGKIQAEELRQQIGERLPGAFAFAQQALKDKFPDLNKALEEGKVGAENMLLIAESVRKAAQGQLPQAIKSLDAEQQRFNNSVLFFKQQIAEAGFADAYVALLQQLTDYFKSTDGKAFAATLGEIAAALVNGVAAVIRYKDEFQLLLGVLAAIVSAGLLSKLGVQVAAIAGAFNTATLAATLFSSSIFTLRNAFTVLAAVVAAFVGGYSIGAYLRDQYQEVRIFGIAFVTTWAQIFSKVKFAAAEFFEDFPRLAENAFKEMINKATENFRTFLMIFQVGARGLGLQSLGDGLSAAVDKLTLKVNSQVSSRVAKIRADAAADLARIKQIGEDMLADELGNKFSTNQPSVRDRSDSRLFRDRPLEPRKSTLPVDDKDIKKRQSEIEALEKALEGLQSKTLKKQGETLSSLLAAVDVEYADLRRRIVELGGKEGKAFLTRFERLKGELKIEITKDYNEKLLKEQADLEGKLEQLAAAAGRRSKDELQARLDAVKTAQEGTFRDIQAFRDRLLANGRDTAPADAQAERARALVLELQNQERIKFIREQVEKTEASINDLLKAREIGIKQIEEKVIAGTLTRSQADGQILSLISSLQPQIESATDAAREFALANEKAIDPNRLQEFLLKMEQTRNSSKALNAEFDRTGQIINSGIISGLDRVFDSLYESIGKLSQGTADLGDVFESAGRAMLGVIAETLKQLAVLYLKEQALIAIQAIRIAMSGGGSSVGGGFGVGTNHTGGVIGRINNHRRQADPAWFTNAPRYHSGGIVGLAPDEYPAILQKNEEVLSASNPRNIMNGGGMQPAGGGMGSVRVVLVDDTSRVAEAMNGAAGEKVVVQHIRNNLPTLRQLLK